MIYYHYLHAVCRINYTTYYYNNITCPYNAYTWIDRNIQNSNLFLPFSSNLLFSVLFSYQFAARNIYCNLLPRVAHTTRLLCTLRIVVECRCFVVVVVNRHTYRYCVGGGVGDGGQVCTLHNRDRIRVRHWELLIIR